MMKKTAVLFLLSALLSSGAAFAQEEPRDNFYYLSQINKASDILNTRDGLLTPAEGRNFARAIQKVIDQGNAPGGSRPRLVITYEPYLIKEGGPDITKIHAGRSSQDMLSTTSIMEQRDHLLVLSDRLNQVQKDLIRLAEENKDTLIPNYTNGVAAQPNSLAHYLIAYANAYARDSERLQQYYARLNRSPMGATVLNGTGWPLDRDGMASYLGFDSIAYNTYDAGQVFTQEAPIETAGIVSAIAIHTTGFIEEIMQQYAQPRPWILLREGADTTYVSSAMPQKRNPGLLNSTRADAGTLLGDAAGAVFRAHNIPAGMPDGRISGSNDTMVPAAAMLGKFDKILNSLVIDKNRSLEELDLDWTCSQEIADRLMKNHGIPFREGHHFASEIVTYARAHQITPMNFTYDQAKSVYDTLTKTDPNLPKVFPMSEQEWNDSKDPAAIVRHRAVKGGPQPAELEKMISMAKKTLARNEEWTRSARDKLASAENRLNRDFEKMKE